MNEQDPTMYSEPQTFENPGNRQLFDRFQSKVVAGMAALALSSSALFVGESSAAESDSAKAHTSSRAGLGQPNDAKFITIPEGVAPPIHYVPEKPAKAVVVTVHGGAWLAVGEKYRDSIAPQAKRFFRSGYEVWNIDYRAGRDGVSDVRSFVGQLASQETRPIIAWAESAGAHIALTVARNNKDIDGVIGWAGPYDLPALKSADKGWAPLHPIAEAVFGLDGLKQMSPALLPWKKRTPMLLAGATNDLEVPYSQVLAMEQRASWADTIKLRAGNKKWEHSLVMPSDIKSLNKAELKFIPNVIRRFNSRNRR